MATHKFIQPSPRVTATYNLTPSDIAVLDFDLADMKIGRSGDDLVFTHINGGRIVLQNFFADPDAPKPSFIVSENAIAGQDLLTALGQDIESAAGPIAVAASRGNYEMSLSQLMDGITALGGLDLRGSGKAQVVENLLPSGTAPMADNQPSVQSFASALTEDAVTHTVQGNVLLGAVQGDGQHRLVWDNTDTAARFGTISREADGTFIYTLNNSLPAVQGLSLGQVVQETFAYSYIDADGDRARGSLVISLVGTNDSPVAQAGFGQILEDGPALHSTLPAPIDVDTQDTFSFVPQIEKAGQYGSLTIETDGSYSYVLNNSLAGVQKLGAGASLTETFSYTVVDSHGSDATSTLLITIYGTNDSPTIAASTNFVREDGASLYSFLPPPVDMDVQDSHSFVPQPDSAGQFGNLTLRADGTYIYTLNNSLAAVQSLSVGGSLTDTFTYTVLDSHGASASNVLTITIEGTNDSPTIAASTGSVTEDSLLMSSGLLPRPVDVDQHDTVAFVPQVDVAGAYGTLSVDSRGGYTYSLDNSLAAVQNLGQGGSLTDTFTYTVRDSHGATATNTLTITINGTNDNPSIAASAAAVQEDGDALHSVLPDPVDADTQDTHSFVLQVDSAGQYGSLSVQADGSYTYTLNNSLAAVQSLGVGASLTDSFMYTVVDNHGGTASNMLVVTIYGSNDSPTITASTAQISEDGPNLSSTLPVPADIDAQDSYSFVPLLGSAGQYGKLDLQTDGSYIYTLNNTLLAVQRLGVGASLTDTFTYTVVDAHGADASNTLTITINGTNDSPILSASAATVYEDGPSLYSYLTPPVDVDLQDSSSFIPQTDSAGRYGTLSVRADGSYTYGLHNDFAEVQSLGLGQTLTDTFTYTVVDAHGAEVSSLLTITIKGTNDNPTISASVAVIDEDSPSLLSVLPTPVDVDGNDTHSFVSQAGTAGAYGSLTVQVDGSYIYTLNNSLAAVQRLGVGESLTDTFSYTVMDAQGAAASNILTIVINGTNDKPTVAASATAVTEDVLISTSGLLPQPVDTDQHDTVTFVPLENAVGAYGTLSVDSSGTYVYTLNNTLAAVQALGVGEQLNDVFTYTVVDNHGARGTNVLTISLNGTNDTPRAIATTASVSEDTHVSTSGFLPVPADVDIHDIHSFVPQVGIAGSYGTFQLHSDGSYTYTLNNTAPVVQTLGLGDRLTDVFVYTVQDNHGATSSNTLTVTINGTNDAPTVGATSAIAVEDTHTVIMGSLATPHDIDANAALTFVPQSNQEGSYGTLHVAADGSYTYTLNNSLGQVQGLGQGESLFDTFTYRVEDGQGGSASNTLVIEVQGTNDAPSVGSAINSVQEDTTLIATGTLPTITDADNSSDGIVSNAVAFVPQSLTQGLYGSLSLDSTGNYIYTLNNNNGSVQGLTTGEQLTDVFIYTVKDSSGGTGNNSLTITINGTNDNPVAVASVNTAIEDRATVVEGYISPPQDIDNSGDNIQSDTLQCIVKNNERGLYGNLSLDADGHYVYVLNNSLAAVQGLGVGDSLAEVFFYTVLDSHGGVSTNTLTLTIQGTNDAPITNAFNNAVFEDYQSVINGSLSARDPDNTLDGSGTDVLTFGTKLQEVGTYGTLTLASDGSYVYTLNNSLGAVQGLTQGEKLLDQFQYTVTDNHGAVSTNTLIISVNGNNDAPVAYSASATVQEDVQLVATGTVPSPTDPDNTKDGIVSETVRCIPMTNVQGSYGTLSLDSAGHYVYTLDNDNRFVQNLDKNDSVVDIFPYLVADEHGAVVGSTIRVKVLGTKEKSSDDDSDCGPNAFIKLQVTEDSKVQDSGHIGSAVGSMGIHLLSVGILTGQYGSLSLQSDGTYVYTLDNSMPAVQGLGAGEALRENFIVSAGMGVAGIVQPRIITVEINGTNDAPRATTSTETLIEDVTTYVKNSVQPYDADNNADGILSDLVTVTPQTVLGQYGLFTITSNGNYTYIVNNSAPAVQLLGVGESVSEQFSYQVQDGNGGTATSTLNFTVMGSNDLPTVAESYNSLVEGPRVSLAGHLPAPVDVDSHDTVVFVPQVVQAQYGQWVLNSSGDYAYTLHSGVAEKLGAGESAVETFSYTVRDNQGGIGSNTLHITIYGRNDAPTVASAYASVQEDSNLVLTGILPPPVDVDAHDNPAFVLQNATEGQYGTLYVSPSGAYIYVLHNDMPAIQALGQGESLVDSLSYTVSDGKGATGTGTLHVTINGTNDIPTVASTVATISEDLQPLLAGFLTTPTDVDAHDSLSFVPLQNVMGMYGSLTVAVDGSFSYKLNSESPLVQGLNQDEKVTDVFTYTVMDGQGARAENTLMVHISGQNDAPITGTLAVSGPVEDGQMLVTGTLPMPIDPDTNDAVTFVARDIVQGEYGTLSVQANGHYVYTLQNFLPAVQALSEGQHAVDEFSIMATDTHGASTAAILQIQIMGSNDAPIITGSAGGSMTEDTLALTGLLPAPMDVDVEDTVEFATQHTTVGQFGTLSVQSDGQYQYTLNTGLHVVQQLGEGESLTETFDYSVDDGRGGKAYNTLTFVINGANDGPYVVGNVEVPPSVDLTLTGVLPAPHDVDQHDVVNYVSQHEQQGQYGVWSIQSDGGYTYTVDPAVAAVQALEEGKNLVETLVYTVQDSHGATASGTLSITIDGAGIQELLHPVAARGYNLLNGDATDSLDFSALSEGSQDTVPQSVDADLGAMLTPDTEITLDTVLANTVFAAPAPLVADTEHAGPAVHPTSTNSAHAVHASSDGGVGTIHVESTESMQDSIQHELVKHSGG